MSEVLCVNTFDIICSSNPQHNVCMLYHRNIRNVFSMGYDNYCAQL